MEKPSVSSDSESEDLPSGGSESAFPSNEKSKKRTLAQEVKDKLRFGRRKPPAESTAPPAVVVGRDSNTKPTPEIALGWSRSFETLLMDKYGLDMFREFLRTEFSEENVEFWIACEKFKNAKTEELTEMAEVIYNDYVVVQAPRQINLDSKTRLTTGNNMAKLDRQTFEVAQKRIEGLMAKDSYPRFLKSEPYRELLGNQRHKLKLK